MSCFQDGMNMNYSFSELSSFRMYTYHFMWLSLFLCLWRETIQCGWILALHNGREIPNCQWWVGAIGERQPIGQYLSWLKWCRCRLKIKETPLRYKYTQWIFKHVYYRSILSIILSVTYLSLFLYSGSFNEQEDGKEKAAGRPKAASELQKQLGFI